jgi:hypothetical protein
MPGGRPPAVELTEEVIQRVCGLIEEGDFPDVAAGACGIPRRTYFSWMEQGRRTDSGIHHQFCTSVALACDVAQSNLRRRVQEGDDKGESFGRGKASLEILQRRFPKQWAVRVKQEIDDSNRLVIDVVRRVCREEDRTDIFIRVCEELSRLDSEGESSVNSDESASAIH